ncbi:MAG: iron uptake system protein EfeO [Patulibacter sp.]
MLATFVIGLREGVEAALIVALIAAFLKQEGRTDAFRSMWIGVGAAVALCAAIGVGLRVVDQQLPQREQEGLETVIAFAAVGMVTWMIVWMRRHARGISTELRAQAGIALASGSTGALVTMAFLAVIREGVETVVFLTAVFDSATNPTTAGIGALLGIAVACALGVAIYRGGVRLNLDRFFRLTALVLVFVAAGLVASAFHSAHEAGWVNFGQQEALDLSWLVVPGTWTSSLLTGMLGLQPHPVTIELIGYLVYLIPMSLYVLWPSGRRPRAAATATTVLAALAALVGLGGCGSSNDDSASAGAQTVDVKLTDAGCELATDSFKSGLTTFKVTNAGTSKVSEFEVLDGARILGEKENLVAGLSGKFTINIKPGEYTASCPGGQTAATTIIKFSGGTTPSTASTDKRLQAAVTGYQSYVESQAADLTKRTTEFVAALKAGDTDKAKALFASTRAPYERIEPVAESFGDLDPRIDARVNDVAKGDEWTGFHRIEQILWVKGTTDGTAKYADQLLADVKDLQTKTKGLTYEPEELANGANGLLDEVSASKITGEEDRYSHTDLTDFQANVDGSETTFGLLGPALKARNAELVSTIQTRFAAVQDELKTLGGPDKFPSYDTIDKAERQKLSQLIDALAEPLSKIAGELQSSSEQS